MSGLVGISLSVLGFTSVVDKNGIDSMHPANKSTQSLTSFSFMSVTLTLFI